MTKLPKVYCKYCYKYVSLVNGDGIYQCSNCGAGLAEFEHLKVHGAYKRQMECAESAFAVMNEALEYYKKLDITKNDQDVYPKCPHYERGTKKLYGWELIDAMRKQIGLPDMTP